MRCGQILAATMLAGGAPGVAAAQAPQPDTARSGATLQEIVITVRKVEERLQDAPISVAIATEAALERAGVTSLLDLGSAAPGVVLQKAPTSSQVGVTIRGLGSSPGVASFESSVGLFVNGAYVPRTREFTSALFDVERVEVIKGTQGALLGKNTSLGAVNVILRGPAEDFGVEARVGYESELESFTALAAVEGPLSDSLRLRAAYQREDLGGWVENVISNVDGEATERESFRLTAAWRPSAMFDATLMMEGQDSTLEGSSAEFVSATPGVAGPLTALAGYPGRFESNFDRVTSVADRRVAGGANEQSELRRAVLTANLALGDYTLTSVTGWSTSDSRTLTDTDFLAGDFLFQDVAEDSETISQELRVSSPSEKRFRYVAGVFASTGDLFNSTLIDASYPFPALSIPTPFGPAPINGASRTNFDQSTDLISVFGQVELDVTDRTTAFGALRLANEEKEVAFGRVVVRPGAFVAGFTPPSPTLQLQRDEDVTDGTVGLRHRFSDGLTGYASWSQGTKSGGFAQSATNIAQSEFEPEVAQTVEAGLKYQSPGRAFAANATIFRTEVEDYQLVTFNGAQFVVANTDLESSGVEWDMRWAPAKGLELSWANTYAKAEDSITGDDIPRAPRWAGSVGGVWTASTGGSLTFELNASVDYRSSMTHQQDPESVPRSKSLTLLNAGIGVLHDQGWELRFIGRNLTDDNAYAFAFPATILPAGNALAVSEAPRTFMVQLGFKR